MDNFDFPPIPEGTQRIRPLIWVDVISRRGKVRVFADKPGETVLIHDGLMLDEEDPSLQSELESAKAFYLNPLRGS